MSVKADMMTEHDAIRAGWYYDPLHHQPVYLIWSHECWRARFVWQNPLTSAPFDQIQGLSAQDEVLTLDMYHRLIPIGQAAVDDYTSIGGCAIRDLYGMRHLVHVKPALSGRGVFIQAPAVDDRGQCDPLCRAIWLSDDEIPTIIRALQARRRAVLAAGWAPNEADK